MDTDAQVVKDACGDVLKNVSRNRRHALKKEFFDKVPASELSKKSPVKYITDDEWQALLKLWLCPRHMVCLFVLVSENCLLVTEMLPHICLFADSTSANM